MSEPWQVAQLHLEGYEVVEVYSRDGVPELVLRDSCGDEPEWEPARDRAEELLEVHDSEIRAWLGKDWCPICTRPALVPGGFCLTCEKAAHDAGAVEIRGDPTPHLVLADGWTLCGLRGTAATRKPAAERALCTRCHRSLARRSGQLRQQDKARRAA